LRSADARVLALLAILCVPVFFWGLGRYGVVNADEAIYHGIAERMAASGDWLHLDFRGEARFYDSFLNAPLHYFARATLIELFGSNAWTMRILSATAGAATVLVTAGLAMRLVGARAGLLAGVALLTSFQFVYLHGARTGELDTLVSLCFVAIAWLFERALAGRSFVPHHLVLIALFWTKTPLALVPLAVELGRFAFSRDARPRLRAYLMWGLALAPLAASWHVAQLALGWEQVPEVLRTFRDQASGARTDGEYTGRLDNALFYLRTIGWGLFPWSAALPFALVAALRDARLRGWLVWPAALLVFFTLVAKHYPWYVVPTYPFFALCLGVWLADLAERAHPAALALAAAVVAAALACVDAIPPNPFAEVALMYPMRAHLRDPAGVPAWAAAVALAALACCAAHVAARRSACWKEIAAASLVFALVGAAGWRTARPLAQLDTQSQMQLLHTALSRARARGESPEYPIPVPPGSIQIARFLFADDYEMEARATPLSGTALWLHPKGDPAVLERSIGRLGLEKRLAQ
jgi:4-amino-4-deoxy-L-arabinose transferase-like glycosyltransferase